MSGGIFSLPNIRAGLPCRRCSGLRKVTFDQLDADQKAAAPYALLYPCPDCGDDATVIPIDRRRAGKAEGGAEATGEDGTLDHVARIMREG